METKIHIGQIIRNAVKSKKMTVTSFASSINCTTRNVYKIFDKESVDTALLEKISRALNQNFFVHYLNKEDVEMLCKERSSSPVLSTDTGVKTNPYKLHETMLSNERPRV